MIDIHKLSGRLGNEMFRDAYIYAQYRDGMIPDIYLQSEKYFEKYKDEIKARYSNSISRVDGVAVHVRRGDYVGNPFYIDLVADGYYERAMALFTKKEGPFYIVSDDIEWCKKQEVFRDCSFPYTDSKDTPFHEAYDLNNIASCTGQIIANSSFSWWGAYLSPHGGKVVAPKQWFTDGAKRIDLPSEWIVI